MLMIRLRAQGCHKKKSFRIVVADRRSPRDGKYMEMLGWYHPYEVKGDRVKFYELERGLDYWMSKGAQMTDIVKRLIKRESIDDAKLVKVKADRTVYKKKRRERQAVAEKK